MPFSLNAFKQYIPGLTLFALIAGLLLGIKLQGHVSQRQLDEQQVLREIERGPHMPVIVQSPELNADVDDPELIKSAISNADPLKLKTSELEIPDPYANAMFNCRLSHQKPWFAGDLDAKSEAFKGPGAGHEDEHLAAQFRASGTIYKCDSQTGRKILVATGISISAPLHPFALINVHKDTAWATYTSFAANLYLTFLMMLFLPTLAISLVQAIIGSAASSASFRRVFWFFVWSSLLGASLGATMAFVTAGFLPYRMTTGDLEVMARSVGEPAPGVDYDPHPVLTQLGRIIPTNPLGALTDASGNSGLQVAFLAVVIGVVLAALSTETRKWISGYLKKALALVISDRELKWTSLSDYADVFAPLGVFFFTMTAFASADIRMLGDLADLALVVAAALLVHVFCILTWLHFFRNGGEWWRKALFPGLPGLLTAFATASSYAALPAVSNVPLLQADESKRGVFNLGTTLNKNGTSVYLAASASFIYLHYHNFAPAPFLGIVLLSTLAGTIIAGLPFAAIVGLRMILVATGLPGGLAWLLLPIDPLADRLVTPVNVLSNLAGASDAKGDARTMVSIVPDAHSAPPPQAAAS